MNLFCIQSKQINQKQKNPKQYQNLNILMKLLIFLCAMLAVSTAQSISSFPISLPNSSFTITGISYIQNTNWLQIAISGPNGGYTELYNITNATTITKISSQKIYNSTNTTYAFNLINLPNSYLVAATVEPNFDVSKAYLSIWDSYSFKEVITINNIGQVQYPWINDRIMMIAANPLTSTGQASVHAFNVVSGALITTIKTEFQNITSISSGQDCLIITGQKAAYPQLFFVDVIDSLLQTKRFSFNYSVPVASMSTFFRTYQAQRFFTNQVLMVWNAQANATQNLVMVLDASAGSYRNITLPLAEVVQNCWAGDAYQGSFVCQTHNMKSSVFQFFNNFAYRSSQTPSVSITGFQNLFPNYLLYRYCIPRRKQQILFYNLKFSCDLEFTMRTNIVFHKFKHLKILIQNYFCLFFFLNQQNHLN